MHGQQHLSQLRERQTNKTLSCMPLAPILHWHCWNSLPRVNIYVYFHKAFYFVFSVILMQGSGPTNCEVKGMGLSSSAEQGWLPSHCLQMGLTPYLGGQTKVSHIGNCQYSGNHTCSTATTATAGSRRRRSVFYPAAGWVRPTCWLRC